MFEARQEERVVAETGKARVAQIPVLRRLMFVGLEEGQGAAHLAYVRYVEAGVVLWRGRLDLDDPGMAPLGPPVVIGPFAMQKFATTSPVTCAVTKRLRI